MSTLFSAETYPRPLMGDSWDDNEATLSPFDELFSAPAMFENVDLSNLTVPPMLSNPQPINAAGTMSLGNPLSFKTPDYEPRGGSSSSSMGGGSHVGASGYLTPSPFSPNQASTAALDMVKAPMNIKTEEIQPRDAERRRSSATSAPRLPRSPSTPTYSPRKRKSTSSTAGSPRSPTSPPPSASSILGPRKNSHNMIEKRYRTNLNDKIAALRDAVPSLRVMVQRIGREGEGLDGSVGVDQLADDTLGGLAPAHKLNKATVLSKATEYIAHLERNNAALMRENSHLRNRTAGLEMIIRGGNPGAMAGAWG